VHPEATMMSLPQSIARLPVPAFLAATASLSFLSCLVWFVSFIRGPKVPKGLRRPPSPPKSLLYRDHSHLWSGNTTTNPSQTQLVKWAHEFGEIYEVQFGVERWVVLSSPEAVKVSSILGLLNRFRMWLIVHSVQYRRCSTSRAQLHPVDRGCG
jgi:hypothetical protein